MALIPSTRYSGQTDTGDPGYPSGKARNAGSFQDGTGTPLEKDWLNDQLGFQQALLVAAGITPSNLPDKVGTSQYLDAVQALAARAVAVQAQTGSLLGWANVSFVTAPPSTFGLGVVFDPTLLRTLIVKGGTNGSCRIGDDMTGTTLGTVGSLGLMKDAAYDPVGGKVVAVTNFPSVGIAYSTDFGATFTDSASGVLRDSVVWDATHSLFLATKWGTATIYTSPTGVTWTSKALTTNNSGAPGVAVLTSGRSCCPIGTGPTLAYNTSTNGTTWASSGGTLPDIANATASAVTNVVALGTTFYVAAAFASGAQIRIHSSTNATAWTLLSTIVPVAPAGDPVLLADNYSKALYVVNPTTGGFHVYASLDLGVTWLGPSRIEGAPVIKAAGGRLWASENASVRCTVNRLPAA